MFAALFEESEPFGELDLVEETEGAELDFDFEPAKAIDLAVDETDLSEAEFDIFDDTSAPSVLADDQFAEPDNIAHTKEAESETVADLFYDEDTSADTDEDFAFEDDIIPVWLRRPRESDLSGDSSDTGQDDVPPQAPEWLRDVFEEGNGEDGDGDDFDFDFD